MVVESEMKKFYKISLEWKEIRESFLPCWIIDLFLKNALGPY